eukprot:2666834-Pyramimonas_sp.AAC.1
MQARRTRDARATHARRVRDAVATLPAFSMSPNSSAQRPSARRACAVHEWRRLRPRLRQEG